MNFVYEKIVLMSQIKIQCIAEQKVTVTEEIKVEAANIANNADITFEISLTVETKNSADWAPSVGSIGLSEDVKLNIKFPDTPTFE